MKIVNSLKESGLLLKGICGTIKMKNKKEKKRTTSSNVVSNISYYKRKRSNKSRSKFSMSFHPSINFEIQQYYQSESKFNGIYLRNSLSKINHQADVINLDEYKTIGTHCMYLYHIVCEY